MLKSEKDSNKSSIEEKVEPVEEYVPTSTPVDLASASSGVPLEPTSVEKNEKSTFEMPKMTDGGFMDDMDDEFFDYSSHMRNRGKRRMPDDFDLDGDFADDFEYIPNSSDFSYLHHRKNKEEKKPLNKSLNELPDEIKAIMLSDIFDRKFFD